jgi:dipeptide transport system ATP-binding protein
MDCAMHLIPDCGRVDFMALLDIKNLSVDFRTGSGWFRAVDGVSLSVDQGDIHAIVGESGSGKSVAMLAVMGLLPRTARVTADLIKFSGNDLLTLQPRARRAIVGKDMTMIFQEPMTSLNPCFTVGYQIGETLRAAHLNLDKSARRARAIELMESVGIPDPASRLNAFPHQFSGGMAQRVMIAMALASKPKLIIADEPTTALDVTIQAQILDLLTTLQKETGTGLILITHSMGVVAETAERVSVHYAGQKVEEGRVADVFSAPRHPYTAALLEALPERARKGEPLRSIPGTVPGQFDRPKGCLFAPRCGFATELCQSTPPSYSDGARCHFPLQEKAAA